MAVSRVEKQAVGRQGVGEQEGCTGDKRVSVRFGNKMPAFVGVGGVEKHRL